jgi:hypothetical protein
VYLQSVADPDNQRMGAGRYRQSAMSRCSFVFTGAVAVWRDLPVEIICPLRRDRPADEAPCALVPAEVQRRVVVACTHTKAHPSMPKDETGIYALR